MRHHSNRKLARGFAKFTRGAKHDIGQTFHAIVNQPKQLISASGKAVHEAVGGMSIPLAIGLGVVGIYLVTQARK